jgi:hypothetical protein
MTLAVKRLTKESVADFFQVNCESNGLGWCNCVAWWCSWKEFGGRTAEQNKAQRESLFNSGEYDGYLLYEDGKPIAWSQCGPARRLKKLCDTYKLIPEPTTWAITCFALVPSRRKCGLSQSFLNLIIEDLKSIGVKRLLGFPVRCTEDPWTGPESIFKAAGFGIEKDDEKIPVYSIQF